MCALPGKMPVSAIPRKRRALDILLDDDFFGKRGHSLHYKLMVVFDQAEHGQDLSNVISTA